MKRMKQFTMITLTAIYLLSSAFGCYANDLPSEHDEYIARMTSKINDFFGGHQDIYTFYDENINDITDQFYARNLQYYSSGQIEYILQDIQNNIYRIEKTTLHVTIPPITRGFPGDVFVDVEQEFTQKLETFKNGHSHFVVYMDSAMLASYTLNHNIGIVYDATEPTLSPTVYFYNHAPFTDWMAVIDQIIPHSPSYGSGNKTVTFSMDIRVIGSPDSPDLPTEYFPVFTVSGTYGA